MENVLRINLKEILHSIAVLFMVAVGFALFAQYTQQSVNKSVTRALENQNNHAIFALNY